MNDVEKNQVASVSDAIESVRAGRLNEALRMLARGDIDQLELEETLRIYHAELHIQNDELRQSQRRMEQSQQRFMRLFDSQPAPVMVLDAQGVVKSVNKAGRDNFGQSDQELQGRFFVRLIAPEDQALLVDMLESLSHQQETELVELRLDAPSGRQPSLVRMARQDVTNPSAGETTGHEIIVHLVDISAMREKEAQVAEQKELLARVSDEIPGALMHYRVVGKNSMRYEFLSRGMETLFGHSVQALLDDAGLVFAAMHPQDRFRMEQVLAQMHAHPKVWQDQFRIWSADYNDWRWLQFNVHPKIISDNESEWFGYVEDITESRQATRMLISHARRAAMGDMLGHITHQWKQPLNALKLSVDNLEDAANLGELDGAVDEHVATSHRLISQMTQTIQDFVQFFNTNKPGEHFDPKRVVSDACDLMIGPLHRRGVELEQQFADADMTLFGQPNELIQVIMILLQNALEVLTEREVEGPKIRVRMTTSSSMGQVRLQVIDNGGGVAPEHLNNIFEAYYTTREKGSGIGLYLARLIVESTFGGTIECICEDSETIMSISLPGAPESADTTS